MYFYNKVFNSIISLKDYFYCFLKANGFYVRLNKLGVCK